MFKSRLMLILTAFVISFSAFSQTALPVRNAHIRLLPDSKTTSLYKAVVTEELKLLEEDNGNHYYRVRTKDGITGYVYRTLVRLSKENPSWEVPLPEPIAASEGILNACSFNIKFIGSSPNKRNEKLCDLLTPYDLVVVQELVAPPYDGFYSQNQPYKGDVEAAAFFNIMTDHGFASFLSSEDTGRNENHTGGSSSEWFVVFYRPEILVIDSARCEFLSEQLVANEVFDRVPFRFQFSTVDKTLDFSIINVHLASAAGATEQRKEELAFITNYINSSTDGEKDYLIVGDMNIQSSSEYSNILPQNWLSLNDECVITNLAASKKASSGKPYDHVMYEAQYSATDIDTAFGMQVIDIFTPFYLEWAQEFPTSASSPYWVASFASYYSDHHPVAFRLVYGVEDDD